MTISETNSFIIRYCIEQWKVEFDISVYDHYMEIAKRTDLKEIVKPNTVTKDFLFKWGGMGRVLGRDKHLNWESSLQKKINQNHQMLKRFRNKNLFIENLKSKEKLIEKYYESFRQIIGPIATSKTLHLICPNFFPLWDNAIANSVRIERCKRKNLPREYEFSGKDYFDFMKNLQNFKNINNQVLLDLEQKYDVRIMRLIDEFLWWMTHRPLSMLF